MSAVLRTRELAVANAPRPALVDADVYERARRHHWFYAGGLAKRSYTRAGRRCMESLGRFVLRPPRGVSVRHLGDRLDCRREMLTVVSGHVRPEPRSMRAPWRVVISIDGRLYDCGHWPTRERAELAREAVSRVAPELRGRGFSRRSVQRRLDLATGREVDDGGSGR